MIAIAPEPKKPKKDVREETIQEVMKRTGASHEEVAKEYDAFN